MTPRGLGIDIVSRARLQRLLARHGDRFRRRCFQPRELAGVPRGAESETAALAAGWAVKEAFIKAVGVPGAAVPMRDIEVARGPGGASGLILHGAARNALRARGARGAHVACAAAGDWTAALVVLE